MSAEKYLEDTALAQLSQLAAKLTVLNSINVDSAALTNAQVEQLSGFIDWASYAKNHVSLAAIVSTKPDIQDERRMVLRVVAETDICTPFKNSPLNKVV
ncbi:hypothetical protein Daesc_006120 [Daldinia eschscholtzii]|uniref:Uncharacterized protein n=1 Tax=Daldinia eschscholtzii TaxID=292717 RepID=A0AAX6MFW6_9PEZI